VEEQCKESMHLLMQSKGNGRFEMSVYVLVHGGSVDGSVWNNIRVLLEARGHRVFTPSLSDEHTSDLGSHIAEVCSVIEDFGLSEIVLAGHSYGGMVITGVANRLSARISQMIYIDAAIPDPGQSLFDLFRSGGFDPLSFKGLDPYPPYVEKLGFNPEILAKIPKTYIRCTKSDFVMVGEIAKGKIMPRLKEDNWTYLEIPSDHTPMISMPDKLMEIL
jgi:pimeloyl-ACP methyl ester carboxylesterase